MKRIKLLIITLLLLISLALTACNKKAFYTQNSYDKVHILETNECYKIKKWINSSFGEQLEITLEDDTVILISSNNCILIKGECPICSKHD